MAKAARVIRPSKPRARTAAAALREPKTDVEVDRAVGKAVAILMQRGVRECLRQKLPSTIVLMAAGEMAGLTASMMGLPYAQALQAACNGVEASYRRAGQKTTESSKPVTRLASVQPPATEPKSPDKPL